MNKYITAVTIGDVIIIYLKPGFNYVPLVVLYLSKPPEHLLGKRQNIFFFAFFLFSFFLEIFFTNIVAFRGIEHQSWPEGSYELGLSMLPSGCFFEIGSLVFS